MCIKNAAPADLQTVKAICEKTISEIYPHYYPGGAVEFFLQLHNEDAILQDIAKTQVYLCLDTAQKPVGTVTIKENEIERLFVLPSCQGCGCGTEMLHYAERMISRHYAQSVLAASLPAKEWYQKRGYRETSFYRLAVNHGDFLCYDLMSKKL